MKILWLDINASYGHASLALPAIHAQQRELRDSKGFVIETDWSVLSATTQADPGFLAAEAVAGKPDLVLTTLWLFTREMVLKVLSRIKAL
ncbi:MAG: B12-binding domain-containing radical SAM protein, partial [Bacteroidales bacterium]